MSNDNKYRVKGVKGSRTARELKDIRRNEAKARQEDYDTLTVEQKLAQLDSRPGKSKRERARLTRKK